MNECTLKLKEKIENLRNELNIDIINNIDIKDCQKQERTLALSEALDCILLEYIKLNIKENL